MTEQHKCLKESDLASAKADIRALMRDVSKDAIRLEKLEDRFDNLSEMSTALSVMSVSLEHIVEHNQKQDVTTRNLNKTLSTMNDNLNLLNQGQMILNEKVANLEQRMNYNEDMSKIDLREIQKESQVGILKRYGLPVGVGAAILAFLMELIRNIKTP